MRSMMIIMSVTFILLLSNTPVSSAEEQSASEKTYEHYNVIYERNIFSKDRRPPQAERSRQSRTRRVLSLYVLRGTAVGENEKVAFIEEQVSGRTTRANVGSEVLDGRITEIQFNQVAFEQDGETKYIRVGGEFGKTESTVVTTVSDEALPEEGTPESAEKTPSDGGDESDILRRLMERRQSELGQ